MGDVEILGVQRVLELESLETATSDPRYRASSYHHHHHHHPRPHQPNTHTPQALPPPPATQAVPPSALHAIQSRTAIVVPCKDECVERIAGVWAAIPASSLIVLVSGSSAGAYARERDALDDFCRLTGREGVAVRQRDPEVARALREAGMGELLDADGDGLAYSGKGEGLVIGIALAATARGPRRGGSVAATAEEAVHAAAHGGRGQIGGEVMAGGESVNGRHYGQCYTSIDSDTAGAPGYYKYIGFIDADNFVPGSVQEYCRAFSAGLYLAQAEDAMVRISWGSKPKVRDGKLEFKQSGRSSEIVNRWLNSLLRQMDGVSMDAGDGPIESGKDAGLICTGNAGEHAMTISLALKLRLASGYAIEPFHFLDLWERFAWQSNVVDGNGTAGKKQHSDSSCCNKSNNSSNEEATGYITQLPSSPLSISPLSSPVATPLDCSPLLSASEVLTSPTSPSVFSTEPTFSSAGVPTCQQLPPPLNTACTNRPARHHRQVVNTTFDTTTTCCCSNPARADADMTPPATPVSPAGPRVQILQIRTLNPHFHEDKGEAHVLRMWRQGLSVVYHSPVTTGSSPGLAQYREDLRSAIFGGGGGGGETATASLPTPPFSNSVSVATTPLPWVSEEDGEGGVRNEAAVLAAAGWQPERCRIYPPAGSMRLGDFVKRLEGGGGSFWSSGKKGEEDGSREAGESDPEPDSSGIGFDSVAVLGLGPVSRERRPEGDVDMFRAFVDEANECR